MPADIHPSNAIALTRKAAGHPKDAGLLSRHRSRHGSQLRREPGRRVHWQTARPA